MQLIILHSHVQRTFPKTGKEEKFSFIETGENANNNVHQNEHTSDADLLTSISAL